MRNRTNQNGVTLLELMIVLAVAAILAAIGAPSFTDFVRTTRLNSAKTQLVSDLNFARSEAVKRNIRVLICAANTGNTTCNAVTDWASNGWLICFDADSNNVCDDNSLSNPNPIQIRAALHSTLSITGPNTPIRLNPIGSQGDAGNSGVNVTISGTWSSPKSAVITVAGTGNITSTKVQ